MPAKSIATEFKFKVGGFIFLLFSVEIFYFAYSSYQQANEIAQENVTRRAYSLKYDIQNQLSELSFELVPYMDNKVLTEVPVNLLYTQFALKQITDLVRTHETVKSAFISDGSPYVIEGYPLHTLKWASPEVRQVATSIVNSQSPNLGIRSIVLSHASLGEPSFSGGRYFFVVPLREALPSLVRPYRYSGALFIEVNIETVIAKSAQVLSTEYENIQLYSKEQLWYQQGQVISDGFTSTIALFEDIKHRAPAEITITHAQDVYTDRFENTIYLAIVISIVDLLIILWFLSYFGNRLIKPLKRLEQQCKTVSNGQFKKVTEQLPFTELQTLQDTYNTMANEIESQVSSLKEEKARAEQSEHAKSLFLANMSHEIRTPMNGILGTFQLLANTPQDAENTQLVKTGLSSARSLLHLLNDILDFSKMEAGKLSFELVVYDIKFLFNEVLEEFKDVAALKNVKLLFQVDNNFTVLRKVDSLRLKQVVRNLISNAIKFTHEGLVTVSLHGSDKHFAFDVIDTGIGMTDKQVENLFNRFSQADASTTRKYGGTGLGLAIIRQLVELMDGEVKVISKEGQGTTFSVSLPIKEEIQQEKKITETLVPPDLTNTLILLAEDNKINQTVFCAMLKRTNAEIIIANDGVEAVALANKHQPDLIFMDIQMPNLDGIGACSALIEQGSTCPIIALTANVMPSDVEYYLANNFVDCVGKPIEMQTLYQAIYDHFPTSKSEQRT
ncbi:hypothetical protein PALB_37760 [Pseudoalteromonas luteoviolacea B = ATCC 29581]|nr:hypothetical protein PALB_37760 [Pseudoalteromonas luteoviolacea B = ATCC 29581]